MVIEKNHCVYRRSRILIHCLVSKAPGHIGGVLLHKTYMEEAMKAHSEEGIDLRHGEEKLRHLNVKTLGIVLPRDQPPWANSFF